MPYRISGKIDFDALAIDVAPKPPTRAQRLRHAGLVVALTVAALALCGWAVTFIGRHTKVIGAVGSGRRFEPPRTARMPMGEAEPETPDDWDFDPFSGETHFRPNYYETESGDFRPVAPILGLRIDDASSENILISRRDVRRGAAANAGRIHDCFRAAVARSPRIRLQLRVRFNVIPSGATTDAVLFDEGTDKADRLLVLCVTRNFSNLFYRNIGATQHVAYLLRFESGG